MANPLGGQSSGDFRETSGRVNIRYIVTRDTYSSLTPDSFTQTNPALVTASANKTETLSATPPYGVLGSSVAFTRPDAGNGLIGGPVKVGGVYDANVKPIGIYLNDALGNPYENTPGVASQKGSVAKGSGTLLECSLYETKQQVGGSAALTYSAGDVVYASVNGFLTNRIEDAYEYNVSGQNDPDFVTVMGVVRVAPDASNHLLVVELRV